MKIVSTPGMPIACMPRLYEMPDPDDRTPNAPHVVVEFRYLLGLYNQVHPDAEARSIGQEVKDWFRFEVAAAGWCRIEFVHDVALLGANVLRLP